MLNYIKLFLVSKNPQTYQVIPTVFFLKQNKSSSKEVSKYFLAFTINSPNLKFKTT